MMPLTAATRRALLDEFFANRAALEQFETVRTVTPAQAATLTRLQRRQGELLRAYRDGLPRVPLARCPFSNELYTAACDVFGLDGPWWDYYNTQRPHEEPPSHWVALTGALRPVATLEKAPFLALPGPAAPYVIPRVLQHDAVRAVLHAFRVGAHTAFAITYFATHWPEGVQMPNLWGTDCYRVHLANGDTGWYTTYETPGSRDFDLAPWLTAGKLLWIAPGDATLALRATVPDCPFVGLPGTRDEQRLCDGVLTAGDPE